MTEETFREICPVCWRPKAVCYCAHVPKIETETKVAILQHRRERDVPINTARIASLCLTNGALHNGIVFDEPLLRGIMSDPTHPPILLYPGDDAIDIAKDPPKGPVTLVVLDGTWWQAKKLFSINPLLASLPKYSFTPPEPSNYRIRSEPQDDYVSTIEAVVHVLGILEKDPERMAQMLVPFRAMVDAQLAYIAKGEGKRRVFFRGKREMTPYQRLPTLLREPRFPDTGRARNLVCIHGEANAWPWGSPERNGFEEMIHWGAERIATGETFECLVRPPVLAPGTLYHLEIEQADLDQGIVAAEFQAKWDAFVQPDDVFCSWGPQAPELLAFATGKPTIPRVDLRQGARSLARGRVGAAADYLDSLGLERGPLHAKGRTGYRLAEIVAIARELSERAIEATDAATAASI